MNRRHFLQSVAALMVLARTDLSAPVVWSGVPRRYRPRRIKPRPDKRELTREHDLAG